ncbi:site-specific integrase [Deefgea sp. CFH1-16]|uniref:tyrosine-type recombinase/integrase n=1 Tax=Deefgea sp. CFH1-16 TaxID=2675457 RepID=UPI001FFD1A3E|nr:site-specific integrase [Deefgea sp. CFH1-16]
MKKNIRPFIGALKIEAVTSLHVDDILEAVRKRGAPSIANKALRMLQNIFDYAIRRRMIAVNPAAAFRTKDAGGELTARDRALSRTELALLFAAMKQAKGFSVQNELTIKLLLVLCCRKMELCAAQWDEFDLEAAIWHMRDDDVKTGKGLDVPLPPCAVEWLRELKRLSGASPYILPARKMQHRGLPHICEGTIGTAMGKLKPHMPDVEAFTVHDLRRTARTQLAALGVDVITAERCLNHKIKGVHGTYDRHDYFDERKAALIK